MTEEKLKKAWVIAVDMGYGHQRTAYPLRNFAFDNRIINANNYKGIPEKDRNIWETTKGFYEFISRFKKIPVIGEAAFWVYDKFQKIPSFYPKRDLSKPIFSLRKTFSLIKNGWGKDLIERITPPLAGQGQKPLPLITTFFIPVFMAEVFQYPGEIFCVICDADVSRSWVSLDPQKSRIKYFAPNSWVAGRLKLYGVKEENIFLTGYPLPIENTGTEKLEILKDNIRHRLLNLDPQKKYYQQYRPLIEKYLGSLPETSDHILTIMFSIGGAGAQKEIVIKFIKNLTEKIKRKEIKIILTAGIRKNIKEFFLNQIENLGLKDNLNKNIEVIFAEDIGNYFRRFNQALNKTDILWTKPSELSFYSGLGLPIIVAPSIGSQEDFNRKWLLNLGAGISQENPKYADQWIFDYLNSGRFAEAAMQGFIEVEKLGTYNILKYISNQI